MMRLACLLFTVVSAALLKTRSINDEIQVDGEVIATGDAVRHLIDQCAPLTKPFTSAQVCGCNYQLHVTLTADCKDYHKYKETVGDCDCSKEGCRVGNWTTGYTDTFNWKANSYKVTQCKP